MTYEYSSDTHLVTAYGPESLWIYDVATTNGAELLQVSTQSGAVVDVVPMPKLYRPLLAADDGGVWVANSIEGSPGPALSYVASGASAPTTVVADTGLPICWLTADGTSAWVGAGVGWNCGNQMVQKYVDGARGPVYSTPRGRFHAVLGRRRRRRWPLGDAVVRTDFARCEQLTTGHFHQPRYRDRVRRRHVAPRCVSGRSAHQRAGARTRGLLRRGALPSRTTIPPRWLPRVHLNRASSRLATNSISTAMINETLPTCKASRGSAR